ncbi:MAG TPA: hypothetical protein VFO66_04815 [Gemmatimonadaceae bacterium]|nr:hypothetical protein [Gemmatimonadaceae bacterium]
MIRHTVEPWIEQPLEAFVADSGVLFALMCHPSGQVLGQHGFLRAIDVMSASALAAAIWASSAEIGKTIDGKPFNELHAGAGRQLFLARAETRRGPYIFLTVFDEGSSLGLVRLYFTELRASLASNAPPPEPAGQPVLAENFEGDLNKNLAVLFGKT